MHKLFLAFALLVLSIFPNTNTKVNLEQKIRSQIDGPVVSEETASPAVEINTAELVEDFENKSVQARAAYFLDLKSGQVLISKSSEAKLPIASLTKLMTALIAVENTTPNEVITVPAAASHSGDAVVGLKVGDKIKSEEVLKGILITSASDAALAMASHVSGNTPNFVALMNERANLLGLKYTQFTNPVGWDEAGNYSTAHDLAILTKVALSNPRIAKIASLKSATIYGAGGQSYKLTNTNALLNGENYLAGKTGTTYQAGECLATYYKDNDKEIVGVLLNSPSRFNETRGIINWIKNNYIFRTINK